MRSKHFDWLLSPRSSTKVREKVAQCEAYALQIFFLILD